MADWHTIAIEIDVGPFEVSDYEASFLETILQWHGALTPKQLHILTQMTERYLGLDAAAELRGQQRIFTPQQRAEEGSGNGD